MKKYYFLVASIVLLFTSVVAFSDNLFTDVGQKSNSDPKFIIHGLFCFAWFIILVIQTSYIRNGNRNAHIRLGVAGAIAAAGVFVSTIYIFAAIFHGWEPMNYIARCNRIFMPTFALLVFLGYRHRKNPVAHKRLIFVATLYMLGPILDRAMNHTFLDSIIPMSADDVWVATLVGIWTLFFMSLFIYDWVVMRRIHRVTSMGFLWFVSTWIVCVVS